MMRDFESSDFSLLGHLKEFSRSSFGRTRQLTLNEAASDRPSSNDPVIASAEPDGSLEILVNNTRYLGVSHLGAPMSGCGDVAPLAAAGGAEPRPEETAAGSTEVWEIVNLTGAVYPMRPRFLELRLIARQGFKTGDYNAAYVAAFPTRAFEPGFGPPLDYRAANNPLSGGKEGGNPDVAPYLEGPVQLPLTTEEGWRNTVLVPPGMVTRIVVRRSPTGLKASSATAPIENGRLVEELCASRERLKAHWRRLERLPEERRHRSAGELRAEAGQALIGLRLLGRESGCAAVAACAAQLWRIAEEAQEEVLRMEAHRDPLAPDPTGLPSAERSPSSDGPGLK